MRDKFPELKSLSYVHFTRICKEMNFIKHKETRIYSEKSKFLNKFYRKAAIPLINCYLFNSDLIIFVDQKVHKTKAKSYA